MPATRRTASAIVACITLAGLAACTPVATASPVAVATSAPGASSTPAPAATTAAPVAVTNGAVLTADQAKALPEGTVAYKMQDGSLVAVVHGQSFPDVVVADVNAVAKATFPKGIITATNSDTAGFLQQQRDFNTWIGQTAQSLSGGTIIVVTDRAHYVGPSVPNNGWWVTVTNSYHQYSGFPTKAEAVANANADVTRLTPALAVVLNY